MEFKIGSLANRHVLIIGGAGYIGSVLTKKMLSRGYWVRVLDNLIYDNGMSVSDLLEEETFSFIHGDFGNDEILEKSLENITDVVLLAALVGDPICKKYPDLAGKVNVDYPKKLIRKINGKNIQRFVFTSTCSNYGLMPDDSLANEDSGLNPQSLYAETKVEIEKYILGQVGRIDYSPAILRLSTAFGMSKRMRFDLTVSEFTKELSLGRELVVYNENTWRPYCNVSDISDAIIKIVESPDEKIHGQVFNIGSDDNNYTKKMIVELIRKHIPDAKIIYKTGGFDPRNYRVSFEKARTVLNFKPRITAEDSIKQIINAIGNHIFTDIEARIKFYTNSLITLQ